MAVIVSGIFDLYNLIQTIITWLTLILDSCLKQVETHSTSKIGIYYKTTFGQNTIRINIIGQNSTWKEPHSLTPILDKTQSCPVECF